MQVRIFTPTYYRQLKTEKCINSLIESINLSNHDVTLFIGDNNSPEEMKDWMRTLARENVRVCLSDKNLGKAAIINWMYNQSEESGENADYFISVDSDMIAEENDKYNWIDELVKIMEEDSSVGLLSTFQTGANCHIFDMLPKRKMKAGHVLCYGRFNGIAGGCVILHDADIKQIGVYQTRDIYAGDDAMLLLAVDEVLKKGTYVVEDVRLSHQLNTEEEKDYQKWKYDRCQVMRQNMNGRSPEEFMDTGFYENLNKENTEDVKEDRPE